MRPFKTSPPKCVWVVRWRGVTMEGTKALFLWINYWARKPFSVFPCQKTLFSKLCFDRFGAHKNAPPHFNFKIKLSDSCQKCWSKTLWINEHHVWIMLPWQRPLRRPLNGGCECQSSPRMQEARTPFSHRGNVYVPQRAKKCIAIT